MADNKKKRGGSDRALIALGEVLRSRLLVEEVQDHAGQTEIRCQEGGTLRQESGGLHPTPEAQGRRQAADRVEPALRGPLLVEEIQGHAGQAEERRRRGRAFIQKGRRLSRQENDSQEGAQEGAQEGRKKNIEKNIEKNGEENAEESIRQKGRPKGGLRLWYPASLRYPASLPYPPNVSADRPGTPSTRAAA